MAALPAFAVLLAGAAPVAAPAAERALLILIDTSGSLRPPDVARAAELVRSLTASAGDTAIGLVSFDDAAVVRAPLGSPASELIAAAEGLRIGGSHTVLHDALYDAAQALAKSGARRRAIVLLTDGRDDGSALVFEDAARALAAARVAVFTVGSGRVDERFMRRLSKLTDGAYSPEAAMASPATLAAELLAALDRIAPVTPAPAEAGGGGGTAAPAPAVPAPSAGPALAGTTTGAAATPGAPATALVPAVPTPSPTPRPPSPSPPPSPPPGARNARLGGSLAWLVLAAGVLAAALTAVVLHRRASRSGAEAPAGPEPEAGTEAAPLRERDTDTADVPPFTRDDLAGDRDAGTADAAEAVSVTGTLPLGASFGAPTSPEVLATAGGLGEADDGPLDPLGATVMGRSPVEGAERADVEGDVEDGLDRTFLLDLRFVLVVKKGRNAGESFLLPEGGELVVGRSQSCDVVLGDSSVSGRHLRLHGEGKSFSVSDLNSSNGTFLNDRRLEPGRELHLREGDTIRVGETELVFRAEQRRR